MKKFLIVVFVSISTVSYSQVNSVIKSSCPLKMKPDIFSEIIGYVYAGRTVEVTDVYNDNFLEIKVGDTTGYVHGFNIVQTEELDRFNVAKSTTLLSREKEKARINAENQAKKLADLVKVHGKWAKYVQTGEIALGMPARVLETMLGRPDKINESVGSWGKHEQWVYELGVAKMSLYYFENGVLTSWQR